MSLHLELIEAWLPFRGCTIIFENPQLTKQPIDSHDVRVLAALSFWQRTMQGLWCVFELAAFRKANPFGTSATFQLSEFDPKKPWAPTE